jgi:arylsulfatase A-like enzyme
MRRPGPRGRKPKVSYPPENPTLVELLKAQGYMTGQFGKNHLGDRDEHLPTAHGFDEFFGSLYHLNAEDEPEHPDYPKDPEFRKKFGPRGVLHTWADGRSENTGPLTKKRMETVDEEFAKGAINFMQRAKKAGKPFFVWWNSTRMHIWTRLKKESEGKTGLGITDALAGKVPSPRKEFFYFNDDGALVALRYDQWKLVFAEQRAHGLDVWQDPFVTLRVPKLFNLRSDPFETADHEGMDYNRWRFEHLFLLVPAQQYVGRFLTTFKEFPPRQKVGSFGIDQVLKKLTQGAGD